jgi:hypothetical protein
MREAGQWDRAVAFCRQASALQPNTPLPYIEAAKSAESAHDSETMIWAAGNLLSRDWPVEEKDLHREATDRIKGLGTQLKAKNRTDDANRLAELVNQQRQRDLVIELVWTGDADMDLEVKEPIGTTCSFANRQTPGGGTLVGDHLTERSRETYKAAQAFAGDYRVTVRRVWGQPLGNKVTLKITENQGTPHEKVRHESIAIDRAHMVTVNVADGRRKSVAEVPPVPARPRTPALPAANGGDTLARLRGMADPSVEVNTGMKGGLASSGTPVERRAPQVLPSDTKGQLAYQEKVPTVPNGVDMVAKMTMLPDGRRGWSVSPVFESLSQRTGAPLVTLPLIPGGKEENGL